MDLDTLAEEIARRVAEIEERDRVAEASDIPERLQLLKQNCTWVVYDFVRAGLFEKDKLTVMTLITLRIMVDEGLLDKVYVDVLVRGRMADEVSNRGEDLAKWLNETAWARLKGVEEDLAGVDSIFENMSEKVTADADDWEEWYNTPDPEQRDMPGDYKGLNEIQKILLLRVFRPDRLPFALTAYVRKQLGDKLVNQPPFNMATTYTYTVSATPVLFVLYPGVDPTSWVEDLGKQKGITAENGMFVNISMGQGQEKRADQTILTRGERRMGIPSERAPHANVDYHP